jgi:NADPH-dependent curcumin reductase CurA
VRFTRGPHLQTGFQGLFDVGKIKAGETLVVSGAAGATGSLVCQFGKLKGAKVIAIAGGPEKCQWLKDTLKVDMAIDYKSPNFHAECKKFVYPLLTLLPQLRSNHRFGYLDVFFDNVGGEMRESTFLNVEQHCWHTDDL